MSTRRAWCAGGGRIEPLPDCYHTFPYGQAIRAFSSLAMAGRQPDAVLSDSGASLGAIE